ncbi:triple tyrosine motif-containing protein [Chiayiivirga flava]|nr:triple tyrosine motif-containing protein [Chiayiivirga flava]
MLDAARRAQPVPAPSLRERFDFLDGLPGTPAQYRPLPTAVQGSDGRLWFATTSGVVWIDPRTILRNPLPPPVAIRAVFADGHRHDPRALRLPADTARLEIDYTALSLSVPERVRFRYRLDGIDTAWQDVGDRRRAFYTNPGPGEYVFRVQAANNDGVWNDTGATLALSVAPHFYQSTWFALLCALAVIVLLRLFHRRRMATLAAAMRARMQERHDERERIARELHDTLLQGFQGLILRFQGVADRLPADDPLRETMERALDRAEGVLVEGRDRVRELRAADGETSDLRAALLRLGQDLEADSPTRFRVAVVGRAEPLTPLVREEIYCIVREAIFNAFQHADARLVEVEISYARSELRVSVRDDGRGIDADVLGAGRKPGHWGLPGMRERAQRVGASVEVLSKPGVGTDVLLRMPRALAFADAGSGSWWQALRRRLRRT